MANNLSNPILFNPRRKIPEIIVTPKPDFRAGLINAIGPRDIKRGATPDSLNWQTKGDKIELRRGQAFLGTTSVNSGNGKASGIKKVIDALQVEHLFGTYGKKVKYFDIPTLEWIETGSNILGSAVVDSSGIASEPISIEEYISLSGNQVWINSPNCAGYFKIMTSNPATALDQTNASKNFKGNIKIDNNRTLLWKRLTDKTSVYGSYIDAGAYRTLTNLQIAQGDGSTKVFTTNLKGLGVLSSDGTTPSDGDTVTIGTQVYTLKTTVAAAYSVHIGGSATASLLNLFKAINLTGVAGTDYGVGTLASTFVTALAVSSALTVQSIAGVASATIATTVSSSGSHMSWNAATITGSAVDASTVFAAAVTLTGAVFTDNYAGTLTGSDGSTGTINYATGAVTLSFVTAPTNGFAILASFQVEDSTNTGIADYTHSGTRAAGQGFVFLQGDGGILQNILGYNGTYYCMHLSKTWALVITQIDTSATNLPYRQLVGIPNQRAAVETGEGIYYIDDRDPTNIKVRLLTYGTSNSDDAQQVLPIPISNNLILNNYNFDSAASILWGDLVLFSCRQVTSTVNDRILCYNKLWKSWDILDYNASCFDVYNGTLVCGDSVTNNFITLFSGFDDLGSVIDNYWTGNMDSVIGDGLKKTKFLYLEGDIGPDQAYDVFLAADDGNQVKVGSISGRGDYVDKGQSVSIGGTTLGEKLIGGNQSEPIAYHYEFLMRVNADIYEYSQIKFQATGIGYVSVRNYRHYDVRYKGKKIPLRYRNNPSYPYNLPKT